MAEDCGNHDRLDDGQNDKLWALGFHEDNLFHNRLQIFLTAHALLLAPVGFLLSRSEPPRGFLIGLAALGTMLGLVWLIVQLRSRAVIERIENYLDGQPAFRVVFPTSGHPRWSQEFILAAVLPGLIVISWIALGFAFCFRWI